MLNIKTTEYTFFFAAMSLKLAQKARLLLQSKGIEEDLNFEEIKLSYKRGRYVSSHRLLEKARQQEEQRIEKRRALENASTEVRKDLDTVKREKRDQNIVLLKKRLHHTKKTSKRS
jgi:hypothetical protein